MNLFHTVSDFGQFSYKLNNSTIQFWCSSNTNFHFSSNIHTFQFDFVNYSLFRLFTILMCPIYTKSIITLFNGKANPDSKWIYIQFLFRFVILPFLQFFYLSRFCLSKRVKFYCLLRTNLRCVFYGWRH